MAIFTSYDIDQPVFTSNSTTTCAVPNPIAILGMTAVAMGAWPLALGLAGWTAGGVAAGSFAAGAQAAIGNVVAGSPFAMAQSAAMGGAVADVVNGIIAGTGAGAAAVQQWCWKNDGEYAEEKKSEGGKRDM